MAISFHSLLVCFVCVCVCVCFGRIIIRLQVDLLFNFWGIIQERTLLLFFLYRYHRKETHNEGCERRSFRLEIPVPLSLIPTPNCFGVYRLLEWVRSVQQETTSVRLFISFCVCFVTHRPCKSKRPHDASPFLEILDHIM